jgi:hypothetical protein
MPELRFLKGIEGFIEAWTDKKRTAFREKYPEYINKPIQQFQYENVLDLYNSNLDFKKMMDVEYSRKLKKYSEHQSNAGSIAGAVTRDSGKLAEALKLATLKCKELYDEKDIAYMLSLQARGTKAITSLNTKLVECPVCKEWGPHNSWKKYHFDWCGKQRPKSRKEEEGLKSFLKGAKKAAIKRGKETKEKYDNSFDEFYNKCPETVSYTHLRAHETEL